MPPASYFGEPTFQLPMTPCGVLFEIAVPSLKLSGPRTKEPLAEPDRSERLSGRLTPESDPLNWFLPASSPGVVIRPVNVRPPGMTLVSNLLIVRSPARAAKSQVILMSPLAVYVVQP